MARISGVDLPREKRVEIGLTYIYGIGLASSKRILAAANVNPDTRVKDLTDEEVSRIRDDYRKSDVTEVFVIEKVCRFVDRRQRQMPELVRVLSVLSLIRKSNLGRNS